MKLKFYPKPRKFSVGEADVTITDYGKIGLEADEMVSFCTHSGRECDFTAKEWGFYPTSSVNVRMKKEGFKIALVRDTSGKIQINVVEKDKIDSFNRYLKAHKKPPRVICWLDELEAVSLDLLEKNLKLQSKNNHEK